MMVAPAWHLLNLAEQLRGATGAAVLLEQAEVQLTHRLGLVCMEDLFIRDIPVRVLGVVVLRALPDPGQ
eukprot:8597418-Alexandrium_andersonii.AAC.1